MGFMVPARRAGVLVGLGARERCSSASAREGPRGTGSGLFGPYEGPSDPRRGLRGRVAPFGWLALQTFAGGLGRAGCGAAPSDREGDGRGAVAAWGVPEVWAALQARR